MDSSAFVYLNILRADNLEEKKKVSRDRNFRRRYSHANNIHAAISSAGNNNPLTHTVLSPNNGISLANKLKGNFRSLRAGEKEEEEEEAEIAS